MPQGLKTDPAKFGIGFVNLRGLWYIAGNLVRDVAALNKMEMLPWDVWGAQSRPDEELNDDQLAFFDRIAALTREPDARHSTSYAGSSKAMSVCTCLQSSSMRC